jgi:CPA1 family monovalent cation:H+ antiporter
VTIGAVEASGKALGSPRMRRNSDWDAVQFVASGIVFVLLGEQLPHFLKTAGTTVQVTGRADPWWLLACVLAIYGALFAVLLVRVAATLGVRRYFALPGDGACWPAWRPVAATSLAGVRGTITLAGVLTVPVVLADGTAFPGRDLAIFVATGVIIVSLIAATLGLPLLMAPR